MFFFKSTITGSYSEVITADFSFSGQCKGPEWAYMQIPDEFAIGNAVLHRQHNEFRQVL